MTVTPGDSAMPGTMSCRHINRRLEILLWKLDFVRDLLLRNNKGNLQISNRGPEAVAG